MNLSKALKDVNWGYARPESSSIDNVKEVGMREALPKTETHNENISTDVNCFYFFAIPALAIILSSDFLIENEKRYLEPEVRTIYQVSGLNISSLNWSKEEILDTYNRLKHFQEDWDAPGMELYDYL